MADTFLNLNNYDGKNVALKKQILGLCITGGDYSIADLSKELNTSIPTITKLVTELIDEHFLCDKGKSGTSGGRRPSLYGLDSSAGYFAGTDVCRDHLSIAITDFKGELVCVEEEIPFIFEATDRSLDAMCGIVTDTIEKASINRENIRAYGFNLTGRVNRFSGYSFSFFLGEDKPISDILEQKLGATVFIENDSRAMAYGEYIGGVAKNEKDMLFINASWGLGMGMIIDGKLHYGKSGFSGEFGHFPLLNNNQICQCGKTGCLETGASGSALYRIFMEKLRSGRNSILSAKFEKGEDISLDDILEAITEEDMLAIECTEEIGTVLGRAIAGLINIFNPELVVIGGKLTVAKDYLMLPLKSAINKHSLNIVNKDTAIRFSQLGNRAGALGACLLSRSKLLGLV